MNRTVRKSEFENEVLNSPGLSVVRFSTDWSGACQIFEPVYKEMSDSYGSAIRFFTVDVEEDRKLTNDYGIRELPTILFFHNGKVIDYSAGIISKNAFIAKLENVIAQNKN